MLECYGDMPGYANACQGVPMGVMECQGVQHKDKGKLVQNAWKWVNKSL